MRRVERAGRVDGGGGGGVDRHGFDRRLIAPMITGSILNPINSSIISVSLIPIGRAFGAPPAHTAWLVSGLYLATAIGQPVVGRLVDLYGPRRLYLFGTGLVGIAGVLGMLAPNLPLLVVARVLLGFGTCAGYPASMALIRREADRTGQTSPAGVLTVLAIANQTIAVIGPVLGGLLIGVGGWRATLAVNVPLSLACLWLGRRRLPITTTVGRGERTRFDLPGMITFALSVVAVLLFCMAPRVDRWWLLVIAAIGLVIFGRRETRTPEPFIDLHVLRGNLPLVATYLRNFATAVVAYSFLYGYPQWLAEARGLTATQSGLLLLPIFGTAIVVSALTGRRAAVRGKLIVGGVGQLLGCLLLLVVGDDSPIWVLLVVAAVIGIPQGLNNLANQNALYAQAEPARLGSSSGLLRTSMYVGAMAASAAIATFLAQGADTAGLHQLAIFAAIVAASMLVLSLADRSLARVGR